MALENGFKLPQLFEAVRRITEATDAVVVVMTYWNPVLAYGVKNLRVIGGCRRRRHDPGPGADEASAWFEASDSTVWIVFSPCRAVFFAEASGDYRRHRQFRGLRRVGDG